MTDHVPRLYAVALSLVVLFLTWAVVAARPWAATAAEKDPRIVALERREAELRRKGARVERRVQRRFAAYEVRLRKRKRAIAAVQAANADAAAAVPAAPAAPAAAAPPSVGVVSLPPVTSSESS
ncbi:MAG: hypothetical protein ACRDNI_13790 [Gaiellaceae bacterium]